METLAEKPIDPAVAGFDQSRSALEFIHQLLQATRADTRTLPTLLGELGRAFGAAGAGLSAPLTGPALIKYQEWSRGNALPLTHYPWDQQPSLIEEIKTQATALTVSEKSAAWLVTVVSPTEDGGWLLWLQDEAGRTWSLAESAALPLAGQALARLVDMHHAAPWSRPLQRLQRQRFVEQAAAVTGRLAHDFGNVLTGILGFTELSLTQLPENSIPHRYIQEVLHSAQQGASWVRKLQLFSRRAAPQCWPTALGPIIQEEASRLRAAWGNAVTLLVALADDLPPVPIDADSLRQMILPLLDNAREAIDEQGVVTISARAVDLTVGDCLDLMGSATPGRYVHVTITDTGRGLSAEMRARLFQDLFVSTKTRHRGLGLAVVYGLVQTFRGGLRFGPEPKQGTAVHLFLRTAAVSDAPAGASPREQSAPQVLVVDDDPMILDVVSKILENSGYRVLAAPGGAEALVLFAASREPVQLVLTDVMMPGMTGLDLIQRLQQTNPSVNALFISSLDSAYGLPGAELLQEFGILPKPFEPEMLLGAVRAALARGRVAAAPEAFPAASPLPPDASGMM